MKDTVILELAARFDRDGTPPLAVDGSEEAKISNAYDQGLREGKRNCADAIRELVKLLGTDAP